MSKIITAAQAAALVKDGCTLTTTGFNGFGCPRGPDHVPGRSL